ncbi:hypothetical protein F8S13_01455 [Chloroflexia bacterium SDU3-3]|nr:hypothetical protein F8S13_01455 [Chloroflexia bacterium SDU3-3]
MRPLINMVLRLASGRAFLALLIAYCIYMPIFFYAPTPFSIGAIRPYAGGASILDVEPFYSADTAYARLDLLGEPGRAAYRHILLGDMVYPALLGLTLASAIGLATRHIAPADTRWCSLALLPLANAACDYAENALLIWLLLAYPARHPLVASAAGCLTLAKTICGMLSFTALAGVLVALGLRYLQQRTT